jgi:dipeptidyl-peptidase-4
MDWNLYEIMYTERYMSSPKTNLEGYKNSNLIKKASQLKDPLLIIHGQDDDVVVLQHSLKFIDECIKNNTQVDFFIYPNHSHNVRGKDRVHLMQKITDYIELHINK